MTYKALVADDEYIIRRGIVSFLKKFDEIEVVAEVEDGEMALESARETKPDLLFVDVNMPFLNGLQFVEQLNQIQPGAVVVIITGYDRFDYARNALSLGVKDYILKPLMEDVFDQAVERILEKLEEKNKEKKIMALSQSIIKENREALVTDFFKKWLEGIWREEQIYEKMECLALSIPKPYMLSVFYLERMECAIKEDGWDDSLLYSAVENITKEIYWELAPSNMFFGSQGELILITRICEKSRLEAMNEKCRKYMECYLPVHVAILQEEAVEYEEVVNCYQSLQGKIEEILACPDIIKTTKQYMEDNYSREDFSLLEAAETMNISPQHLSRLFKKKIGITFVDYLTRIRIRKAMELLRQKDMKMYEVAEMVGYSSQHYFSSVFKKEMGVSPIEYQKNCSINRRQ